MSVLRLAFPLLALLALGGCFQTDREFVAAAKADFPFTSMTYRAVDEEETYTLLRAGDVYKPEDEDTTVRLQKIDSNMWLVQTAFVDEGKTLYLYGVAVLDQDGKGFTLHKALAEDPDRDPAMMKKYGLGLCEDDEENICLTSAESYLAYVRDRIAAGDEPSSEFVILSKK